MSGSLKIVPHPIAGELFSGDMIEQVGKAKDQWISAQMKEEAAAEFAAKEHMRASNQTTRPKGYGDDAQECDSDNTSIDL